MNRRSIASRFLAGSRGRRLIRSRRSSDRRGWRAGVVADLNGLTRVGDRNREEQGGQAHDYRLSAARQHTENTFGPSRDLKTGTPCCNWELLE